MLTPTRLRKLPSPNPILMLLGSSVCSDRDFLHTSFTTCRITEKDIKTFCSEDESLHL